MMGLATERQSGTLIARSYERVDGANARQFQDDLKEVIGEADRIVILDLQELRYISSAGLRVILLTAKSLTRQGAKFAVCSLSEPIQEIFSISGFDKVIPVHPSLSEAMDALQG